MKYQEIEGDLVKLAKEGKFDVIAHGCNCFCRMKRGLAPQMAEAFGCDQFFGEKSNREGDIIKLGNIDYMYMGYDGNWVSSTPSEYSKLIVVNAYTQYHWSTDTKPLDYEALTLCLRKINHVFKGKHIGLPQIGCHLAGGDWNVVKMIIQKELKDCDVTVVIYKP